MTTKFRIIDYDNIILVIVWVYNVFQLIRQHGESHKIHYEYSIPLEYKSGANEVYDWQGGDWGECTEECAGGE